MKNLFLTKNNYSLKNYFLTNLIFKGRKLLAEKLFHNLLFLLKKYKKFYNFEIFYFSLLNLRPLLMLKNFKISSLNFKIPIPISDHKRKLFAIKTIINTSLKLNKFGKLDLENLSETMFFIFAGLKNSALDKKIMLYREIMDNKIFIKYLK